jgi:starch synthase
MALAYLRYSGKPHPPGVITVHNLAFQGQYDAGVFAGLGLPPEAFALDGVEYFGGVGFLKSGLQAAAAITTVSPTYAQEIRTPEFGMGLEGLMNARAGDLYGIVNGIDTDIWDPATDKDLEQNYTARTLAGRRLNRVAVEERFGLDRDASPLFAVVSRLTWQKGMDILAGCVDEMMRMGGKLVVLGSGDRALEGALVAAAGRHRGRIGIRIGYDEKLSHLIQAGSDAILVPSRFEPCGLTQLYALRYGCIPVVARTGGLADTVIDANTAALSAAVATGIQFWPLTGDSLLHAISRTMHLHADAKMWQTMQRQGMKADVSWDASAARYASLFRSLVPRS